MHFFEIKPNNRFIGRAFELKKLIEIIKERL